MEQAHKQREIALGEDLAKLKTELREEHNTRLAQLEDRERELDERKKTLDDRDNTHARRQIQRDLKTNLEERNKNFTLTSDTVKKRRPAFIAFMILIGATSFSGLWSFWESTHPSPGIQSWLPVARLALSLVAFGSSVVFFIRWQDKWTEAHATEEFRLKRFDLDLARASWLVEVMLESGRSAVADQTLLNNLIERLGTSLFEPRDVSSAVRHPAEEALTAILSGSSALKIKTPNGGIEMDRKGIAGIIKKGK